MFLCCTSSKSRFEACHYKGIFIRCTKYSDFLWAWRSVCTSGSALAWSRYARHKKGRSRERSFEDRAVTHISLILNQLKKEVWSFSGHTHDTKMIWSACTLAFFTFLHAGEMIVPNNQAFNQSTHLSITHVAVGNANNPAILQIRIKHSETDLLWRGVDLYVGRTWSNLCAVSAIKGVDRWGLGGASAPPLFEQ